MHDLTSQIIIFIYKQLIQKLIIYIYYNLCILQLDLLNIYVT